MTPRGTDWTLGALVGLLFTTGMLSLVSGRTGDAWVFALHGGGGAALGLVTGWKLRRVWASLVSPRRWDGRTGYGALAAVLVLVTLVSGWVWSGGGNLFLAGWNLLNWHIALGIILTLAVASHARVRGKPIRARDLQSRRQFLHAAGVFAGAVAFWKLQRPASAALGWRGADRRWTGSYEQGSFEGNAFPSTSWVSDNPCALPQDTYTLRVGGLVQTPMELPITALDRGDTLVALLDCTGGFYSTQEWRGVRLGRLIDEAGPLASAGRVRVISYTGYRWSFPLEEARDFLLATTVGGEPLSHAHGAPVRLVAPSRRGFEWVKWVTAIELHEHADLGAPASTLLSSLSAEGRGKR